MKNRLIMEAIRSEIVISRSTDLPIHLVKEKLKPGEIGIRVLKPKELQFDFICRDGKARDTLLYLFERICACTVFKEF